MDKLRQAAEDLTWLLNRGYPKTSALKMVGNRFALRERQRIAVMRSTCDDESLARRQRTICNADSLDGHSLLLDGYNVLTTVEAALAGGVLLLCRDGTLRDMASMHGTFRRVEETAPAIELAGRTLAEFAIQDCYWLLDQPVSNSGRLKQRLLKVSEHRGWPWRVKLVPDPDAVLIKSVEIIASADSVVLDGCQRWFNLARLVVERQVPQAWIIVLAK
jgi:hypothetical protein